MRLVGRVLTLSGLALVAAACDTNQPAGTEGGTAVLEYTVESLADSTPGVVNVFEATVYSDLRADSNGDGVADTVVPARNEINAPPICALGSATTALVPWAVGFEVAVVRAGTTAPVLIDTTQTATGNFAFSRVTAYDETGTPLPDVPINPPRPISGGLTALAYTSGTATHSGSASYILNCSSVTDLPPYQNTTFQVGRGDLVKVMARRQSSGFVGRPSTFRIALLVNGVPVEVQGDAAVDDLRSDIAFTYLVN